jgi:hypothetical protein
MGIAHAQTNITVAVACDIPNNPGKAVFSFTNKVDSANPYTIDSARVVLNDPTQPPVATPPGYVGPGTQFLTITNITAGQTIIFQNPANSPVQDYSGNTTLTVYVDQETLTVSPFTTFHFNGPGENIDVLTAAGNCTAGTGGGNNTPEAPSGVLIGIGAIAVLAAGKMMRRRTAKA